ncbi:RNA polymerase sigma factor [Paracnuella aquatica]|uniref:RNA polymerase sigma factor n=1 Tax=Paracnuella aquatica TaxID=2268757 RepID=UPI0019D4DACD|nr:sigma factor-like helix-turn-helix DNA-binding protein [Paracnuella aquatica]
MLKAQIHELNLLEKAIVVLYLEDKSYDEIAEIVGISVSNVGTKLSRIKEKLRTNISKQL